MYRIFLLKAVGRVGVRGRGRGGVVVGVRDRFGAGG